MKQLRPRLSPCLCRVYYQIPGMCREFSNSPVQLFHLFLGSLHLPFKILLSSKICRAGAVAWVVGAHAVESHIPAAPTGMFILFFPQKDLLLSEIPSSTISPCCRKTGVEKVMAKEICQKYLEKRAGRLPEDCAEALAMATCLCLRRRNASLAEVSLTLCLFPPGHGPLPWVASWFCFTRNWGMAQD